MQDFVTGFTAPTRGLRVILQNPPLWPLALAPAVITGVLMVAAILTAFLSAGTLLAWLAPGLVHPGLFLVARSFMVLLLLLVLGAMAWMTGSILSIPINDAMSERIEGLMRELPSPMSFREALPRSIAHSLAGVGLWLSCEMLLLPLNLVPGIGSLLEFVLGFGVTAFFFGHQFMDGALTRKDLSFRGKMDWLWENLGFTLGLGSAGTLMLAIPGINLIGLPIAIASGTLLYCEIEDAV